MRIRIWSAVVLTLAGSAAVARADDIPATELDNPVERILLCTPQGPVILQLSLTIEGEPYRREVERIVDEEFEQIAGSADPSWNAAFENGQLLAGRFLRFRTPRTRAVQIAKHDRDKNGLISRRELRSMLLENSDGDTISVVQRPLQGDPDTQFFSLIDVDGDWNLSADELNQASARLVQADIDGDGAFFVGEIGRSDASRKYADAMLAVLLGRPQSGAAAERALRTHYAEGRVSRPAFQFAPGLFDRLDADRDGELQRAELQRIVALPAQITLAIDHGAVDSNEPTRIRLLNTSSEMQGMAPEAARPGVSHHWWHGDGELVLDIGQRAPPRNFKLMALEQMGRLDRNKNGYLEPAEVFLIGQFAAWDLNRDGMVFQKELETAFANEARISRSCIQIDVPRHAPPLWARLDSNRDQLISVRELRQVKDLLAKYDADGDGAVAGRELPFQFAIQIVPATPTSRLVTRGVTRVSRGAQRRSVGPLWFDRMDRNGDGDISPREFLGTPEQFDKMDADRDGLIDPKEATAAKP